MNRRRRFVQRGFTLIELLMTVIIGSALILGVSNVMSRTLYAHDAARAQNELTRQSRLAMQQMVQRVAETPLVLLPLQNNPQTSLKENIREQSFAPATAPETGSIASAILAVTLGRLTDLDGDGIPDADNDRDGRIDEDLPSDSNNDGASGLKGIDDKNGNRDGGPAADNNGDSCPGICRIDDNGDGLIDNGLVNDDDEDGARDEDWYDSVVFYLASNNLILRTPVPWDSNGGGGVTGEDFVEEVIATHVIRFRIERIARNGKGPEVIAITLEMFNPDNGAQVSLSSQVRVGSRL